MLLFWNLVDFLLHLPCIYIEEIWRTKLNCTHLIANQLQVDKIMLIFCCLMWNFYTKLNLTWQFHMKKQIAGIIFQNWNRFLCYHSKEHKLYINLAMLLLCPLTWYYIVSVCHTVSLHSLCSTKFLMCQILTNFIHGEYACHFN